MTSEEFARWLEERSSALKAWGDFVSSSVTDELFREVGSERFKGLLKIAPIPRVKEVQSALKKQSDKRYTDPTTQMTDLVGVRFVVLLKSDIELLNNVILRSNRWTCSRDRHYQFEIFDDPAVFDYQSVHYIVRPPEDLDIDGVVIPADTPCEIQVRTILQHAYAELVHDNIYKPKVKVPESAKRVVARCMALMESTDELFCQAIKEIEAITTSRTQLIEAVGAAYSEIGQSHPEEHIFSLIADTYRDLLDGVSVNDITALARLEPLRLRVAERAKEGGFFAEPSCLVVYWLVQNYHAETIDRWPIPAYTVELEQICSDLGFAGR